MRSKGPICNGASAITNFASNIVFLNFFELGCLLLYLRVNKMLQPDTKLTIKTNLQPWFRYLQGLCYHYVVQESALKFPCLCLVNALQYS
ncbi:hypothetical protein VNO77_19288 [Canavalia gladiata]|uniref:Uncharacterized protein n=1 Tax=Canavalia gladiata TaxID=3824 RepID=A0AAN9LQP3_CANGL